MIDKAVGQSKNSIAVAADIRHTEGSNRPPLAYEARLLTTTAPTELRFIYIIYLYLYLHYFSDSDEDPRGSASAATTSSSRKSDEQNLEAQVGSLDVWSGFFISCFKSVVIMRTP